MIVSEVMPSPDCHDDPTNQHGTGFLSNSAWLPARHRRPRVEAVGLGLPLRSTLPPLLDI